MGRSGQGAGRGLIAIAGAKVWFILTGFAIKFSLPHLFGSPASFGLYESAMGAVSMINMVMIASTIQTVSKFVSESPDDAPALLRQSLKLQLALGASLAAAFFVLAPTLAGVLRDPALTPLFRVAAVVLLCYALYAALVGGLNGQQQFGAQAGLDATFSLFRSTGIIGGAALGAGAVGALGGFAGAALAILLVALFVSRKSLRRKDGKALPLGRWLAFLAPIWAYQLALNGCFQIDGLVLKRTVADVALGLGETASVAADLASTQVGFYRAAQTFAFVPYQLMIATTFIIFPIVSRATAAGDREGARRAVSGAMRFSILVLLALAAPISGAAEGTLRIAYPAEYAGPGAAALAILAFGMVAFALFVIASTILSGAGEPAVAARVAIVSLVIIVVAGRTLVLSLPEHPLRALAIGTTGGTCFAFAASGAALFKRFRVLIRWRTALRCSVAAAASWWTAASFPQDSRWMGMAALVCGGLVYLLVLALLREVTTQDLRLARGMLRRR
ncbi:MAG: oligosaccharide flippase family protein [Myxococcota bacterium]